MMDSKRRIRLFCTVLVAAVLMLALLLMLSVCGGTPAGPGSEEGTRPSLADLLLGDLLGGEIYPETIDWGESETEEPDPWENVNMDGSLSADEGGVPGTRDETPVLNLYANAVDRIYLKMRSFGDYTGRGFAEAVAYTKLLGKKTADFLPATVVRNTGKSPVYTVEIEPLLSVSVLPYYADDREGELPANDVRITGNADTLHTVTYRPVSRATTKGGPSWLKKYEEEYRAFVYDQYRTVDDETFRYMTRIIKEQDFSADDPNVIAKVSAYIRNAAVYNLDYDPALDNEANIAVAFLDTYREGVCRHYAAAATLLFRALGIPARYTVGFAADTQADGVTVVTMSQAHAWVEVYVDGFGWRCVEVTGTMGDEGAEFETEPETELVTDSEETDPEETSPETEFVTEPEETSPETEFVTEPETEPDLDPIRMNGDLAFDNSPGEGGPVMNLYAEIEDHIYLKIQSFGDYTGKGFDRARPYTETLNGFPAEYLPNFVLDPSAAQGVFGLEIEPLVPVSVIPYYLYSRQGAPLTDDVLVTGNETLRHHVNYRHAVEYDPLAVPDGVREYETRYRAFVYGQYLTLDPETRQYMEGLMAREGFSADDPEIIAKVADYISHAATYNLKYNKAMDAESNVAVAFLETYKEGVCSHYAAAATLLFRALGIPARYTVGFAADVTPDEVTVVSGSLAHAWVEVYVDGFGWQYVEVTGSLPGGGDGDGSGESEGDGPSEGEGGSGGGEGPGEGEGGGGGGGGEMPKEVTLYPKLQTKRYDGTPLLHDGTLVGFEEYAAMGYTYRAEVVHDIVIIGKTETSIASVTIYDPSGADVTEEFEITTKTHRLQVYYERLVFQGYGYIKVYDGTPLSLPMDRYEDGYYSVHFVDGNMPAGMTWTMTPTSERTDVGTSAATFSVTLMLDGRDVTDEYLTDCRFGHLEITPAPLTVYAASAEKKYDGTPLVNAGYDYDPGQLAYGHSIRECVVEGTRTVVGRSSNVITKVVIVNADGEDVTANYDITAVDGTLRVRP